MNIKIYLSFFLLLLMPSLAFAQSYRRLCPTPYTPDFAVVSTDSGKMGVVNAKGEYVLPPKYDFVELNSFGEKSNYSSGMLHERSDIERYTAMKKTFYEGYFSEKIKSLNIYIPGEDFDKELEKEAKEEKYVPQYFGNQYAYAFAGNYNDADNLGNPRIHVFDLDQSSGELFKNRVFYATRLEVIPLYQMFYVESDGTVQYTSSGKPSFLTSSRHCLVLNTYGGDWDDNKDFVKFMKKEKDLTPFYYVRQEKTVFPTFYHYDKHGDKRFFDLSGNAASSMEKLAEKHKIDNKFRKQVKDGEFGFYFGLKDGRDLLKICDGYNEKLNAANGSTVRDDSLAKVVALDDGFVLEGKPVAYTFADSIGDSIQNNEWREPSVSVVDSIWMVTPNLYVLGSEGYYYPCLVDDLGRLNVPSPVRFDDIRMTDSSAVFSLYNIDDKPIAAPYEVEVGYDGTVIDDNRMDIPDERLAIALRDNKMRGYVYGAKASLLEDKDKRKARELYDMAYDLTKDKMFFTHSSDISDNLKQQRKDREEELRVQVEEARAAWAAMAASLQGLSNSLQQVQASRNARKARRAQAARQQAARSNDMAARTTTSKGVNSSRTTASSRQSTSTSRSTASVPRKKKMMVTTAKWTTCNYCHGAKQVKCPGCQGRGYIALVSGKRICSNCNGKGIKKCYACNGTGRTMSLSDKLVTVGK